MNAMTLSPVELTNQAMMFRMYLRNKYYPYDQSLLDQCINQNIPDIMDIDFLPGTTECRIKCKKKKSSPHHYYEATENMIWQLFHSTPAIKNMIRNDDSLSPRVKSTYIAIYNDILFRFHQSPFIKLLYSITIMDLNNTSKTVVITL